MKFQPLSWLGAIILLLCVLEAISGGVLLFHYRANTEQAFISLQHIMYATKYLWLWRDFHVFTASAIFIAVYLYVFRDLLQQRYQAKTLWAVKFGLFGLLMLEVYLGNCLPWSKLSVWLAFMPLKSAFLLHVIVVPFVLLGLTLVQMKLVVGFKMHNFPRRCFVLLRFSLFYALVFFIFPNLFYQTLQHHLFNAHEHLQPWHFIVPWYLAPWYVFKLALGWAGVVIAAVLLLAMMFVRENKLLPEMWWVIAVLFIGLGGLAYWPDAPYGLMLSSVLVWMGLMVWMIFDKGLGTRA
tara:strand:- start:14820 stop:15704 length:885 start_codon:yes stop_codon:yes gene_type:complete